MPAYIAVQVTVKDTARYEHYKGMAPPTIAKYGGRYLARGGKTEVLEGTWHPTRFVILEFPTMARAKEWWNSTEYAEAKALRQATTETEMLLIEGV
jgi:uncharacterized protein (DUF1330 family)